jgi:hypothetical protein
MTTKENDALQRVQIEQLLPWHAAGTLNRRDAQMVERALEADANLALQYELARQELSETIHLNETLGAPSSRAMEKLMAGIAAEAAPASARSSFSLSGWISDRLGSLSPATLAWSTAAAALVIALQAGILAGMVMQDRGGARFETASTGGPAMTGQGRFALLGFIPQASAADVTRFLEVNKLSIVDGPRAGGLFRVRIADPSIPQEDATRILERLRGETAIVRLALPTQ